MDTVHRPLTLGVIFVWGEQFPLSAYIWALTKARCWRRSEGEVSCSILTLLLAGWFRYFCRTCQRFGENDELFFGLGRNESNPKYR